MKYSVSVVDCTRIQFFGVSLPSYSSNSSGTSMSLYHHASGVVQPFSWLSYWPEGAPRRGMSSRMSGPAKSACTLNIISNTAKKTVYFFTFIRKRKLWYDYPTNRKILTPFKVIMHYCADQRRRSCASIRWRRYWICFSWAAIRSSWAAMRFSCISIRTESSVIAQITGAIKLPYFTVL